MSAFDRWKAENIAWASGLFEGDGCISRNITTKRSKQYNYWKIMLASTDYDVLERFQSIIGFGRIYRQKRQKDYWKPAWQWNTYRQPELYAALAAMFTFFASRRRAKALEALVEMGSRPSYQASRRESILGTPPIKCGGARYQTLEHSPGRAMEGA